MPANFIACDRDQELLLPPSLREWLPEGHLAWFVIDAVAQLDLGAFYRVHRDDGHGRPAHDPAVMVALLLYCYAIGERSSRRIERRCVEDVATRVICANRAPDHTTIARFRQRHERALADVFSEVLALCAEAGLVRVGVIAVDGTKVHANAAPQATRDYEQIAREILEEAAVVDAEEDERFGAARGDELPAELQTAQGRRGWLREAKRRLDERRAEQARAIPRSRSERLREAQRRLEEEHRVECDANAAYEAYRARGVMTAGRRFRRPPRRLGGRRWGGGDDGRPALRPPAGPVCGARGADCQDQPQRSGLAQRQDLARLGAGLQRPGRHHRRSDRHRRRGQRRLARLRPPRTDGPRRADRARARRRRGVTRGRARRRRLLAPGPDGTPRFRRHGGARPTRRQETRRQATRVRRRGSTPSCVASWPPTTAARSTPSARRWSSPCSPTPSSTAASIASCGAAEAPRDPNGG